MIREKAVKLRAQGKYDALFFLLSSCFEGQAIMAEFLEDEELHDPYVDWTIKCGRLVKKNPQAYALVMQRMKQLMPQHYPLHALLNRYVEIGTIPVCELRAVISDTYGAGDLGIFESCNPGLLDGETVSMKAFLKGMLRNRSFIMAGMGGG